MSETEVTPTVDKPSRRLAVIKVSVALLETILPEGSKILGAKESSDKLTLDFTVSHPSFVELKENEEPLPKQLLLYRETHLGRTEYKD
jgi:hypothetical protein